jgi:PadR family transcriptional regulator AphA
MTMDVKTVCLGMLNDGEASGYDLKKQFESTFAHFFAAGYGSIYPALSSLLKEELVECREVPQEGKPDRKVYRITPKGRERLLAALADTNPSHKIRSEFLATLCFAHLMSDEQVEAVLLNRLEDLERYMQMFRSFESCMDEWPAGMRFVCGFGRALTEAMQDYIETNRSLLLEPDNTPRSATG